MNNMIKKIVIANWKMNPNGRLEAKRLFAQTKKIASSFPKVNVVVAVPFVYQSELFSGKKGKLLYGSQDLFSEEKGSFTGEVSAIQLKDIFVKYAIVGHSERRALGESDEIVAKKIRTALRNNITPILCVGERERDDHGSYLEFLKNEIRKSLTNISKTEIKKIIIAYEPIWAIGKRGKDAMSPPKLHEMVIFFRKVLTDMCGRDNADRVTIIYGGSAESSNVGELMRGGEVSGFLVGHASLSSRDFGEIVRIVSGNR